MSLNTVKSCHILIDDGDVMTMQKARLRMSVKDETQSMGTAPQALMQGWQQSQMCRRQVKLGTLPEGVEIKMRMTHRAWAPHPEPGGKVGSRARCVDAKFN